MTGMGTIQLLINQVSYYQILWGSSWTILILLPELYCYFHFSSCFYLVSSRQRKSNGLKPVALVVHPPATSSIKDQNKHSRLLDLYWMCLALVAKSSSKYSISNICTKSKPTYRIKIYLFQGSTNNPRKSQEGSQLLDWSETPNLCSHQTFFFFGNLFIHYEMRQEETRTCNLISHFPTNRCTNWNWGLTVTFPLIASSRTLADTAVVLIGRTSLLNVKVNESLTEWIQNRVLR